MRSESEDKGKIIKVPRFMKELGFSTSPSRSKVMSKIRGVNTKPELRLRKALWAHGLRFRIHPKYVPGLPDIYIAKYRLVIFVDGDFWHGYQWDLTKVRLKTNINFWIAKIERNIQRDAYINSVLTGRGYTVMRFWEHDIKSALDKCVNQVLLYIEAAKIAPIPEANR